eukprot:CAMPEP_0185745082 /NCGR_PEP_ID=MMETSP1174-20130828/3375_1 /TAXON_ID=35687 /ORGANISM="Dictyocha speculum, Strain CCMP1381" /LENGTH=121 /DNA_ID=CAMNT_0028418879 /DNA_START=129 /DNA_END=493 /DNA_ORIENTATION=+
MAGSVADAKSVEVPPFATTDANGTNASSAAVLPSVNMGVEELLVNSVAEHLYVSTAANVTNASHAEGAPSASMAVAGTTVKDCLRAAAAAQANQTPVAVQDTESGVDSELPPQESSVVEEG